MKVYQSAIPKTDIVFLDCDGVINTRSMWKQPYSFLKEKVELVCRIAEAKGADIVLTSSWRAGFDKDYDRCTPQIKALRDAFRSCGHDIADATREFPDADRLYEIRRYMSYSNKSVRSYIILDDDSSLFTEQPAGLLLICPDTGITEKDVKRAKKMWAC